MKIGIAYPNRNNYSETFIYNHLKYLNPYFGISGGWRPYLTENNENIFSFPGGELLRVFVKRILPFWYPSLYTMFFSRFLLHKKPDVLLAEYGVTGVCILESCQQSGVPLVVHFHGFDISDQRTLLKYAEAYRKLFTKVKAIIVVSEDMREKLLSFGVPVEKVHKIPYGVSTDLFKGAVPAQSAKIVLAVGRFTGKKAPHLTIRAFQLALRHVPDAQLVMIGGGELYEECKKLITDLQLGHAVSLLGVKGVEDIVAWHQKARLFVQHSMYNPENGDAEGTPNSVLEASSSGLPVVSTQHAGIKEAVSHGQTGFLVEEGDYGAMSQYIILLLQNPEMAGEMGSMGRKKMLEEYNMPLQIKKLKDVLEN